MQISIIKLCPVYDHICLFEKYGVNLIHHPVNNDFFLHMLSQTGLSTDRQLCIEMDWN